MEFPLYVTIFFSLTAFFFNLKTTIFSINKTFWGTGIKGTGNNKGRAGARGGVNHPQSRIKGHTADWRSCGWGFLPPRNDQSHAGDRDRLTLMFQRKRVIVLDSKWGQG